MNFIDTHGRKMAANGYPIVPIIPGAKIPGRFMGGEWKPMPGWTSRWTQPPSDFEVNLWSRPPEAGVGVVCGHVVGIDIDVADHDLALQITRLAMEMLGETSLVRIGQAPKRMLVYRSTQPFPGFKRHPLEVLARGQQFVAYAIHPKTGQPYTWPDDEPTNVDITALPAVTEESARAFIEAAFALIPDSMKPGDLGRQSKYAQDTHISSSDQKGTPEAIASALAWIPNNDLHYDDWVYIGLAIKGALGQDGGEIFDGWSSRSNKYDAAYTLKTWDGLAPNRIGAGTVYLMASRNGWAPPAHIILNAEVKDRASAPHPAQAFLDRLARGEIKVTPYDGSEDDVEDYAPSCAAPPSVGATTLYSGMSGAIAMLHKWIMDTSMFEQPKLALAASITAIGAIAGRRYASVTNLRSNIYAVGLADSGSGKDHARKCIKELFVAAGIDAYFAGEKFGSGQAILSALAKHPVRISMPDEFGHTLTRVLSNKAATHEQAIWATLTELFSAAGSVYLGTDYANQKDREREVINNPHICVYGTTVPGPFWNAFCGGSSVTDGALARWLVFETDRNYPPRRKPIITPPPIELIDAVQSIAAGAGARGNLAAGPHNAAICIVPHIVPETDSAQAALAQVAEYEDDEKRRLEGTPLTSIVARFTEHVVKLALIAAVSDNPADPVIEDRHVEWSKAVVLACVSKMLGAAEEHVSENENEARLKKVLKIITEAGGCSRSDVYMKTRGMAKRDREDALASLLEMEKIRVECHPGTGGNPKPRTVYMPV